jgi:hypothetical protein
MNNLDTYTFQASYKIGDPVKIKVANIKAEVASINFWPEEVSYTCRYYDHNGCRYEYSYNACEIEPWEEKKAGICKPEPTKASTDGRIVP